MNKSAFKYILHILAISVIVIFLGRNFPKYEQLVQPVSVKNTTLTNPLSQIKLYEITSELGAGTRGSSLGVKALKIASLGYNSDYFSLIPTTKIKTENDKLFEKVKHPYAKRIPSIFKMWERMSSSIYQTLKVENKFPIILTGDHSNAGGLISGVKMAHPEKKIGLIWIDAHADIHSPYTTPSGNLHGMPIAALLDNDNLDKQRNKIDKETRQLWNKMKNLGSIRPKISSEDIVYIAVRDTEEEEDHVIEKNNIKKISVASLRKRGVSAIVKEVLEYLKVDIIYISFDVDSMDPKLSIGTGTPVENGITNSEAEELLTKLVKDERTVAFEMTEINPTLDSENKMAKNSFKILEAVTEVIKSKFK